MTPGLVKGIRSRRTIVSWSPGPRRPYPRQYLLSRAWDAPKMEYREDQAFLCLPSMSLDLCKFPHLTLKWFHVKSDLIGSWIHSHHIQWQRTTTSVHQMRITSFFVCLKYISSPLLCYFSHFYWSCDLWYATTTTNVQGQSSFVGPIALATSL